MPNIALKKRVEEEHYKDAQIVTNGVVTGYTGSKGFCEFQWPNYLTVDLGSSQDIKCIRFLLWDGLGAGNGQRHSRRYRYRLLLSTDHIYWTVVFDTLQAGYNGWQVFHFPNCVNTRYIRIHGLWNSANTSFHVVEIEAYDEEPPDLQQAEIILERTINTENTSTERGDALPLEHNVQILIKKLEQLIDENTILNPEPIKTIISQLRTQVKDVSAIERNLEAIRREITDPVRSELEKSAKLGHQSLKLGRFSFWGFWVGLIGGILAIFSLTLTILTLLGK